MVFWCDCLGYRSVSIWCDCLRCPSATFPPRKASAAVSEVLGAVAAMDLGAFAVALANFRLFEGGVGVTEGQQNEIAQVGWGRYSRKL